MKTTIEITLRVEVETWAWEHPAATLDAAPSAIVSHLEGQRLEGKGLFGTYFWTVTRARVKRKKT